MFAHAPLRVRRVSRNSRVNRVRIQSRGRCAIVVASNKRFDTLKNVVIMLPLILQMILFVTGIATVSRHMMGHMGHMGHMDHMALSQYVVSVGKGDKTHSAPDNT